MAYSPEQENSNLTYMQRVGQVVGTIMQGYTETQAHVAESERALAEMLTADIALGDKDDPFNTEAPQSASDNQMTTLLGDDERARYVSLRNIARAKYNAAEAALSQALTEYKRYMGSMLLGRTISVHIPDQFKQLQRPGDNKALPAPQQLTGRFAGYDPSSATLKLATDDDVFPVRLFMPDFSAPGRISHTANITAIDFAE